MIYATFSDWAQANHKVPPVMTFNVATIDLMNIRIRYYAESIFEFIDGATFYYKDRTNSNFQYTDDEIIMFKLKNS
jgi:hypothetical protein